MWSLLTFWRMAFQSLCVFVGLLYKSDGLYFVTWLSHPVITVNREPGFLLLLDVMLFNPNRVLSFCPSPGYSRRRPSMFGSWPSQDGEFYPFLPVHLWDLLFVADTLLNLPYHCVWMLREPLPLPEGSLVALAKKPAVLWPPSPSDKEEQSVCSLEGRGAVLLGVSMCALRTTWTRIRGALWCRSSESWVWGGLGAGVGRAGIRASTCFPGASFCL